MKYLKSIRMIVALRQDYLQRSFFINFFRIFNNGISDHALIVFKPLIKTTRPPGVTSDTTHLFDLD